jgi:hypothetical protein
VENPVENFKLNPPPSWPPFPIGWTPGPGWQPGPELPIPLGWQLWLPVEDLGETPAEVDLQDFVDPFATYLPGSTAINRAPEPRTASKAVFREKTRKRFHLSSWIGASALLVGGGAYTYAVLTSSGLIHATVTLAAILALTLGLTGLYTMVTGRQSWAQLVGGRNAGKGPFLLAVILTAVVLATPFFGLDVPTWVPELVIPGL